MANVKKEDLFKYIAEGEERAMRVADFLLSGDPRRPHGDANMIGVAQQKITEAFYWLRRAVERPERVELPGDMDPEPSLPAIFVGEVYKDEARNNLAVDQQGRELEAVGPHWYVKSEMDTYRQMIEAWKARNQKA